MPDPLNLYTLPANAASVPANLRATYRTDGFDTVVRDWHLARVPKFTLASVRMLFCPYCGKYKDPRSMQIDHVIPIRIYLRYRLYNLTVLRDQRDFECMTSSLSSEHENLLLACMKCNTGAGQIVIDNDVYLEFIQGVLDQDLHSDLAVRLETNRKMRVSIGQYRVEQGYDIRHFYLKGADWNTTGKKMRSAPKLHGSALIKSAKAAASDAGKRVRERLSWIHNAVVAATATSRPAWTFPRTDLEKIQPASNVGNKDLRVCFYCFGLFNKQAFQLDHINPASRRAKTPQAYNDPTNLIPVCRTCNTSKGDASLTTPMLEALIKRRQDDGLPGVEDAVGTVVPHGHASYLDYARTQRLRLLGH